MSTNVILFSPGLDSHIAWRLLTANGETWTRIYFDLKTKYSAKEMISLPSDVKIYTGLDLSYLEQTDGFVPQRNVLLTTFAQAVTNADAISLNAVLGEFSSDKHPKFFKQMSDLLSYTTGKSVRVFSRLLTMTKTQAVAAYLEAGFDGQELMDQTVSCYHPYKLACGVCMSCARRWIAVENSGLHQVWDSPPWEWLKSNRKPVWTLAALPKSQWKAFLRAQLDVVSAYRRLRLTP